MLSSIINNILLFSLIVTSRQHETSNQQKEEPFTVITVNYLSFLKNLFYTQQIKTFQNTITKSRKKNSDNSLIEEIKLKVYISFLSINKTGCMVNDSL